MMADLRKPDDTSEPSDVAEEPADLLREPEIVEDPAIEAAAALVAAWEKVRDAYDNPATPKRAE